MPVETINPQWIFSCDCCGAKETQLSRTPPTKWIGINVSQSALDFGGKPCADASVSLLLCRECGMKATDAMNKEFEAIKTALAAIQPHIGDAAS